MLLEKLGVEGRMKGDSGLEGCQAQECLLQDMANKTSGMKAFNGD